MKSLLDIRDLHVEFKIHDVMLEAVRGVSFDIMPRSTVALVGESGSGKSVIAQSIMGILPDIASVSKGEILFNDPREEGEPGSINIVGLGQDSAKMRSIRGGSISMIFQEPMVSLSPLHTVGDQVSEALHLHRNKSKSEGLEITEDMLRLVGFPQPKRALKTYPFELSGGLRQRAMIAMALICHPALLIADEPTTALDVTIQAQILHLIGDLQDELNMAVLVITHDLGVVANIAEEVVVVYHGQVMERGSASDIFDSPGHPYLQSLLRAVPHFDMKPGERLVPVREVKHEVGTIGKNRRIWTEEEKATGSHISVRGISKHFRIRKSGISTADEDVTIKAVDDVSFDIGPGECLGLVGESGCGKTTLSKIIMRALSPDSGTVSYNDHGRLVNVLDLDENSGFDFRRKMQFIFQDPFSSLNPRMTVLDLIREPLHIHSLGTEKEQIDKVKALLKLVGLDPRFLNRYPHSFSGGQRQRIGIARALALEPAFLICDEPVSALDVSIQAQVLNLLKDLQAELGLTYLFISHNLAVVNYVAERIAVMCLGRIVEIAPREVLFQQPLHPYTKALVAAVPFPDLERKLDFSALMEGKASHPLAWPAPFTLGGNAAGEFIEVSPGHYVRAAPGTQATEIAA